MTNLFTAQADDFLVARGGQIGMLPLMCQLTLPHDRSHLTSLHDGLSPKNDGVQLSDFFNKIGGN